jgi:hypothetical protein
MILSNVRIHQALDANRLLIDPEPLPRLPAPDQFCPYGTRNRSPEKVAQLFKERVAILTTWLW